MAEDKTDLDTNSENENALNVVEQILNDLVDDCVGAVGVAETTDIEESEDAYPILLRSLSYPIETEARLKGLLRCIEKDPELAAAAIQGAGGEEVSLDKNFASSSDPVSDHGY